MPSDSPIGDPDVDLWLAAMRAPGRHPATLQHYRWCLQQFTIWIDKPVADVAMNDAIAYSTHLTQRYRPASAASVLRSIRAMYSWLVREQIVADNVFRNLVVRVPEDTTKPIPTEDEINDMIRSAGKDRRAVAILSPLDRGSSWSLTIRLLRVRVNTHDVESH